MATFATTWGQLPEIEASAPESRPVSFEQVDRAVPDSLLDEGQGADGPVGS